MSDQDTILTLSKTELKQIVSNSVLQALNDFKRQESEKRQFQTYTINKASKLLKISYNTLRKHINRGLLNTTKNGRLTEYEINKFLENK